MKDYTVMVKRYGFITVEAENEEDALNQVDGLSSSDFDWSDTENNRLLFEMTAKYGTPYFSTYVNSDMEPSDVRSMCCRAIYSTRKKSLRALLCC